MKNLTDSFLNEVAKYMIERGLTDMNEAINLVIERNIKFHNKMDEDSNFYNKVLNATKGVK